MSLILDALKKSEQKRQLGQAPTLGTAIMAPKPRRNLLPFLLAAIAVAAVAGWFVLRTPRPPKAGNAEVAQAPAAHGNAATTAKPAANAAPTPVLSQAAPVPATAAPAATTPLAADAPAANDALGRAPRTPRSRTAPPIGGGFVALGGAAGKAPAAAALAAPATSSRVTPAAPAPAVAATPTPVATPTPAASTAATAPSNASPPPGASAAAAPAVAAPAPAAVASPGTIPRTAAAPAATDPATGQAKVQPYYELPFPTRKDMPAIKISMHVYTADPAQRFVVINGNHEGEGDSIEGGVTVREIRPSDVVLEFQGKTFFVPRTGI